MKPIHLTILGRTPSKKNTHRNLWSKTRKQWIIAPDSKSYAWEKSAILQLQNQKNKLGFDMITTKLIVEFKIYLAHYYRADLSNLIQSCEDALEKAGVIKSDFQIERFGDSSRILGVPVEDQRAEIIIREFKQ